MTILMVRFWTSSSLLHFSTSAPLARQRVLVLHRPLIQPSIILYKSQLAVLFLDKEDGRSDRRLRRSNGAILEVF